MAPELPPLVTRTQIAGGMVLGSAALLMLGVQPLVLDGLLSAHRITAGELGRLSMVELLALGLTIFLSVRYLREMHLRYWAGAACAVLALADGLTGFGTGFMIDIARGVAGMASGILVWLVICISTRSVSPGRVSGIFLAVQTIWQAVVAEFLSVTIMPSFGVSGAFVAMGILTLCAVPAIALVPSALSPLVQFHEDAEDAGGKIRPQGWTGLAGCLFYTAGIMGLWVFVERIGEISGLNAYVIGSAVSTVLLAQIFGSAMGTVLERKLPAVVMLMVADIGMLAVTWALGTTPSLWLYVASISLFGFLWMMALPFQVKFLIDIDPSRRTSMQLSSAQLFGSSLGPAITSAFVTQSGLGYAFEADMALFVISLLLTLAAVSRQDLPGRSKRLFV
ncbi:hypothetical protein K2X14_10580 [Acetobacter sp. TBRC 12305]|uniref:MFS transporter n=1 Tax=Acetobacter garciniae TaxID=2817435 RepID=A0A939HPF1_9PROT|nr:hypothetical protein [Acetobacter garciniae]MBO1325548.1 hypothetical protein [Acetobacter garciniae]MBX0345280.1 hypothetical protein [Acetobacter garciniae]